MVDDEVKDEKEEEAAAMECELELEFELDLVLSVVDRGGGELGLVDLS